MKTLNIKKWRVTLLSAVVTAGLMACTTDAVEYNGGKLPDKDPLENTYGLLRSNKTYGNQVRLLITEGTHGEVIENVFYQITKPATEALTYEMRVDETLLDAYNQAHGTSLTLLPAANYSFSDGKQLTIAPDKKRSGISKLLVNAGGLAAGEYLLPVTVVKAGEKAQNEWQTIYYQLKVRAPQIGDSELNADQVFMVGYIDVSIYQPLLIDDYFISKEVNETREPIWYRTVGNIVNLQKMTLDYDLAENRTVLNTGSDMRYVLDHAEKYISPLQDKGRKVCLCIEGGGKGIGFCNMSDVQIADFTAQVKAVVDTYGIDGINLWDRNSGYGKEGMPAMNTTSYPKLIKALREALGADKLLTVTDHLEPTAYFWDTTATGGIEVGQYLDYAWSGYRDNSLPLQIVDPWHPDAVDANGNRLVFENTHKPFAGMDPAKYGCINVPWYPDSNDISGINRIFEWKNAGCKQSQILVFELRTLLQDQFESTWADYVTNSYVRFADDGMTGMFELFPGFVLETIENLYLFDSSRLQNSNSNQYNKWLKDW